MRRPLSVLVLAVTIAAGLPSSCLAAVNLAVAEAADEP